MDKMLQNLYKFIFIIITLSFIHAEPYVPGTPGAPWSQEELLIVKSKLYALFKQQYNAFQSSPGAAPNILRLGFHDCLKYKVCFNVYVL